MEASKGNTDSTEWPALAFGPQLATPFSSSPDSIFRDSDTFCSSMPLAPTFVSQVAAEGKLFSFSGPLEGATSSSTSGAVGSTARYKATPPSHLPIPKSRSYVTIPPGLSPTTLLDSPVLFATSLSEPSPTTGCFPLPPNLHESGPRISPSLDVFKSKSFEQSGASDFVFKPAANLGSQTVFPPLGGLTSFGLLHQQAPTQAQFQTSEQSQLKAFNTTAATLASVSVTSTTSVTSMIQSSETLSEQLRTPNHTFLQHGHSESHLPEIPQKRLLPVTAPTNHTGKPSHDGYNWRKYGQKQVKASENPRSYYKCTQANCFMKKIVEQSFDGQIREIIYRGEHNHPKPQVIRRASAHTYSNVSNGCNTTSLNKVGGDSVNGATFIVQSSRIHEQSLADGASEALSPSGSNDEASSKFLGGDVDQDDSESKRRKIEISVVPRTIQEPRVVVQTMSEIDILDDGYHWRKYGQKVVKGNPHPRSYYKCTNIGCPVRKHVERAPADPNAVITTYEGKHNHDVPAGRGSCHGSVETNAAGTDNLL